MILMTSGKNLQDEHLKNVARDLTFKASDKETVPIFGNGNKESAIDEKAEEPKRNLVRKRSLRTVRSGRSRKRT